MKKFIVLAQLLLGMTIISYGQQYPYFNQYFLNPYLYNPATLGNSGFNELNFTYRQQWLGINDAPTTQAFNFQYPTKNNISLGVNFYHDKTILLNTSALALGFAYRVPFSDRHFLKFGLSGGVGFNNFELDKVDNPNDPAIIDVLSQTTFLTGQFGIHYQLGGLKVGFSLPQLFKYSAIDTVEFQKVTIDQLNNFIVTVSYRFRFAEGRIGLEPFALYRKNELLPATIEGGAMFDYNNVFWVGGTYRKDYGPTAYIGFNILENISFGYAYEFAGGQYMSFGNGSHEFNLKIHFGKNKHKTEKPMVSYAEPVGPVIVQESAIEPQTTQETKQKPTSPVVDTEEIATSGTSAIIAEFENEKNEEVIEETDDEDLLIGDMDEEEAPDPNYNKPKPAFAPGYYVVLGAFEIYENAVMFKDLLNSQGLETEYGYVEDRGLYYVYNLHTLNEEEAVRLQAQFMQLKDFKDAWVYEVR